MKDKLLNNCQLVSVIIPTYNRGAFIERAILSVLNQTYGNIEVIVIDDGSTDDTYIKVKRLESKDPRIQYIRSGENRGSQCARNIGIEASKGAYIAFLDSDDEWLPWKLERQLSVFGRDDASPGVVYGGFRWKYEDGRPSRDQMPRFQGYIYRDALREWIADTNTLLVKKTLLLNAGLWDERIRAYQEWDLCIRLAKSAEFAFVNEVLAIYHNHSSATISKNLLRSALGYFDVISAHCTEIYHVLGRAALADHLLAAGQHFIKASQFRGGVKLIAQAVKVCPSHVKASIHLLLCLFGADFYLFLASLKREYGKCL